MALNGVVLGGMIKTATDSFNNLPAPLSEAEMEARRVAMWNAVGNAIVTHLTTAGVINTTVATTGTAVAQTGTGVGTIS